MPPESSAAALVSTTPSGTTSLSVNVSHLLELLEMIKYNLTLHVIDEHVIHDLFVEVINDGTKDAFDVLLMAFDLIRSGCDYLGPEQRSIVAIELTYFLQKNKESLPRSMVVKAVILFLCIIDHPQIIRKLIIEEEFIIKVSRDIYFDIPDKYVRILLEIIYIGRNVTAERESPCAGILCEEIPDTLMDTIDLLVQKYFPHSPPQKKWLMLDIAKALNLEREEGEEEHELVYYKLQDYPVIVEALREPHLSETEKDLLLEKFFNEVRKWVQADHRLKIDDVEEVWDMGHGSLPLGAVRSFIALLKVIHNKKVEMPTSMRARLMQLALRCNHHECEHLPASDVHSLIFAVCNAGIRDGIDLPQSLKDQLADFIYVLKNMYIEAIEKNRWKRNNGIKVTINDYSTFSYATTTELEFLKDWMRAPIEFGTAISNITASDSVSRNITLIPKLFQAFFEEKRPDVKYVLADNLLDSYNYAIDGLGSASVNTMKIILLVVHGVRNTSAHQNDLIFSILDKCIDIGEPCLNVSRSDHLKELNLILENMNIAQNSTLRQHLANKLHQAALQAGISVSQASLNQYYRKSRHQLKSAALLPFTPASKSKF